MGGAAVTKATSEGEAAWRRMLSPASGMVDATSSSSESVKLAKVASKASSCSRADILSVFCGSPIANNQANESDDDDDRTKATAKKKVRDVGAALQQQVASNFEASCQQVAKPEGLAAY